MTRLWNFIDNRDFTDEGKAHIDRIGKKKCSAMLTALYNSILHDIDRMGNSCVNLVDMAISGEGLNLLLESDE